MKKYLLIFFLSSVIALHSEEFDSSSFLRSQWEAFTHAVPAIGCLSLEDAVEEANVWEKRAAASLNVNNPVRKIDVEKVRKLYALLQETHSKIFMRHGEQQKSKAIQNLSSAMQKIEMMRLPHNMEDSLTPGSTAEWLGSMIIWEWLRCNTNCGFIVYSSVNQRAQAPACALARSLKADICFLECLNCINYPSEEQLSHDEILKIVPDGTLPWEKAKVDFLIGPGTYDRITTNMQMLLEDFSCPSTLVMVTHTQQLNAIASLTHLPVIRLDNYGFLVVTDQHIDLFDKGIYVAE